MLISWKITVGGGGGLHHNPNITFFYMITSFRMEIYTSAIKENYLKKKKSPENYSRYNFVHSFLTSDPLPFLHWQYYVYWWQNLMGENSGKENSCQTSLQERKYSITTKIKQLWNKTEEKQKTCSENDRSSLQVFNTLYNIYYLLLLPPYKRPLHAIHL